MSHDAIIVSGASSPIGECLLPRIIDANYDVVALSRVIGDRRTNTYNLQNSRDTSSRIKWLKIDSNEIRLDTQANDAKVLVHLAPLWVLPNVISALVDCRLSRIIAFGSTSVFTKTKSNNPNEQEMVSKLKEGERWLEGYCAENGINWTLFRPTLVYGTGRDRSITTIYRFVKHFGFLPLVGPGAGLRQPVHADDLAKACLDVLCNDATYNRAYNLTGSETLSFLEMASAVIEAAGMKLKIIRFPKTIFSAIFSVARLIPAYRHLNPEMLVRTEQDLIFDIEEAVRDFGYAPRPFRGSI